MSGERRVYAVSGGPAGADPADFIRSCGLPLTSDDLVIHRVPMAPSPNGPVHSEHPWAWVGRPPAGATA